MQEIIEVRIYSEYLTTFNKAYKKRHFFGQDIYTSDSDAVPFTAIVADPAADGIITLTLTNTQTMSLTARRYMYDVEISYQDSDLNTFIERVLYGSITVNPNITRV
jgi:hypothetical protein